MCARSVMGGGADIDSQVGPSNWWGGKGVASFGLVARKVSQ